VYVSWNGATGVARWRLLSATTSRSLAPGGVAPSAGFQTVLDAPAAARFVAVQALDGAGAVLATSRTLAAPH
jgi:hypothetical protein